MNYYTITLLWLTYLASISYFICHDYQANKSVLSRILFCTIIIILIAIYIRTPAELWFGLEYEDAYEYIYSAHLFANDESIRNNSLNPICIYGNIESCNQYANLPHPTGLPILLSNLISIFGENLYYASYASIIFTGISTYLIYKSIVDLTSNKTSALITSILFLITPGSILFGTSSLAEPTSAALLASSLWSANKLSSNHSTYSKYSFEVITQMTVLISSTILAIYVKREATFLLLLIIIALFKFVYSIRENSELSLRIYKSPIVIAYLLIAVLISPTIFETTLNMEAVNPTEMKAFSLDYAQKWAHFYLYVFTSNLFYLLTIPFLLFFVNYKTCKNYYLYFISTGICISLFISFSQSYYAVKYGEIPYFHFQRYTIQILPIIAIISSISICKFVDLVRGTKISYVIAIFIIVSSSIMITNTGIKIRDQFVNEEKTTRILPIQMACRNIKNGDLVIANDIILFQMFCPKDVKYVSMSMLGYGVDIDLVFGKSTSKNIYIYTNGNELAMYKTRYSASYLIINNYFNIFSGFNNDDKKLIKYVTN